MTFPFSILFSHNRSLDYYFDYDDIFDLLRSFFDGDFSSFRYSYIVTDGYDINCDYDWNIVPFYARRLTSYNNVPFMVIDYDDAKSRSKYPWVNFYPCNYDTFLSGKYCGCCFYRFIRFFSPTCNGSEYKEWFEVAFYMPSFRFFPNSFFVGNRVISGFINIDCCVDVYASELLKVKKILGG